MRRAARIDDNQTAIVSALRRAGWSVLSLASIGKGCPDLLIAKPGRCLLIEVKDGAKRLSARRLTADEEAFHAAWPGPLRTVNSVDEALAL